MDAQLARARERGANESNALQCAYLFNWSPRFASAARSRSLELGDVGYQFLLSLNPLINFVRRRFGLGYWSLSAYAKRTVKDAVSFIGKFEAAVAHYAERYRVDAVLCGHIHSAAIREFGTVAYYNCGDWVESCTALVEGDDGMIALVDYHSHAASGHGVQTRATSSRRCRILPRRVRDHE